MAIASGDILFKLSTTAGSAGNSGSGTPAGSLGKYISTTQVSGTPLLNLFDEVTGDENAADTVDYRCVFFHNAHATLTALRTVVWIDSEVAGGTSVAIAVDTTAASVIGASSAQAVTIATEAAAPAGASFSAPTSKATGLSLGDIPAGSCRAIWVRRTAANTAPVDADGAVFGFSCDTAA